MASLTTLRSHLTLLASSSSRFASRPAFRIPQLAESTGKVEHWNIISYAQFYKDVERMATYWLNTLMTADIPLKAVVGLWVPGWSYRDVLHVYGLSRAGYVPQLFGMEFTNPDVIFGLLNKSSARALIFEPSFQASLDKGPVPLYTPAEIHNLCDAGHESLPPLTPILQENDFALILHTSGSTSGTPKLVPYTYKFLDSLVHKAGQLATPIKPDQPDVYAWMGSICSNGQTRAFLGSFQHGACTVQPTKAAFSSEELIDMFEQCGLNRLNQYPLHLGMHLRHSYSNPKLLRILQSLDEVRYSAMPLGKEEANWAYKNGILLQTHLASTECGPLMSLVGRQENNVAVLRPLEGVSYEFIPVQVNVSALKPDSESLGTGAVSELVVLSDSPDCPHPSLRSPVDGHFHTGDLFEQVSPGCYVFRGRDDDWIKCEDGSRCDTKSIEDNVRSVGSDLVSECVVVGNGRPSPTLFVEPARDDIDQAQLKEKILERTLAFNSGLYVHERITSGDRIIIVDRGILPRTTTKGNVRRRAVEEAFKRKMDELYR